jgi:hypothetical protein
VFTVASCFERPLAPVIVALEAKNGTNDTVNDEGA